MNENGIDSAKMMTATTGPRGNEISLPVQLNGVLPSERLTPKLAERVARVAFGHRDQVSVWDHDYGHGYRLYKQSARKLYLEQ